MWDALMSEFRIAIQAKIRLWLFLLLMWSHVKLEHPFDHSFVQVHDIQRFRVDPNEY